MLLLDITDLFKLSEQIVFLIHERGCSAIVEGVGCLCGYRLQHGFEFRVDFSDPYLYVEAFVLCFFGVKSHSDVQFKGLQHFGILLCRFQYGVHDSILNLVFFYSGRVMAVFLAVVKSVNAPPKE